MAYQDDDLGGVPRPVARGANVWRWHRPQQPFALVIVSTLLSHPKDRLELFAPALPISSRAAPFLDKNGFARKVEGP